LVNLTFFCQSWWHSELSHQLPIQLSLSKVVCFTSRVNSAPCSYAVQAQHLPVVVVFVVVVAELAASDLREVPVVRSCEHGNELPSSIKGAEFIH
jgi:hypothetical protein